MEAKIYKTTATILFTVVFSLTSVVASNSIKNYFGNKNFQFEATADQIHVDMNKNPWESFTLSIDNVEVMNNPVVKFDVMAGETLTLRVDLTDGYFMSSEISVLQTEVAASQNYQSLAFDFSEMINTIDLSENVFLVVYVNPGQAFSGEITIKNFNLTTAGTSGEAASEDSGFNIYPSPATTFTNVEIPETGINMMKIFDMSGKEVLAANVEFYAGTTYFVALNNIPAGYYTVQLSGSVAALSEKLIVR